MTTGAPGASAHEIQVQWPAFYRARNRLAEDIKNASPGG